MMMRVKPSPCASMLPPLPKKKESPKKEPKKLDTKAKYNYFLEVFREENLK